MNPLLCPAWRSFSSLFSDNIYHMHLDSYFCKTKKVKFLLALFIYVDIVPFFGAVTRGI